MLLILVLRVNDNTGAGEAGDGSTAPQDPQGRSNALMDVPAASPIRAKNNNGKLVRGSYLNDDVTAELGHEEGGCALTGSCKQGLEGRRERGREIGGGKGRVGGKEVQCCENESQDVGKQAMHADWSAACGIPDPPRTACPAGSEPAAAQRAAVAACLSPLRAQR